MVAFEMVDMFASGPFTGSPLTVVPEASGLSEEDMAAVAREFGAAETAFVLPPTAPGADYRVRVFTVDGETPFGGHSSLGTAVTLVRLGLVQPGEVVQQCGARLLSLTAGPGSGTVTAHDPAAAREVDVALLTAAAGLTAGDVVAGPARTAGFGPSFHYLHVRRGAVERAACDLPLMRRRELPDVMVFSWNGVDRVATARVFAPGYGIPEDPACASNSLGLGEWLVAAGLLPGSDGVHGFRVRQGAGTPRVGEIDCSVHVRDGRVVSCSVTGRVVAVAGGHVAVGAGG